MIGRDRRRDCLRNWGDIKLLVLGMVWEDRRMRRLGGRELEVVMIVVYVLFSPLILTLPAIDLQADRPPSAFRNASSELGPHSLPSFLSLQQPVLYKCILV